MIGAASVVAVGRNHVLEREILYTTPGTHSWTCPAGVNYVSVVCIGGGGGGMYYDSGSSGFTYAMNGGGGGGLAWMNNISVTPGSSYNVVVGAGGSNGAYSVGSTAGDPSYFWTVFILKANGGGAGRYNTDISGGSSVASGIYGTSRGGGVGGGADSASSSAYGPAGGGGAGGYSGNGGDGKDDLYSSGASGSGGGGGGGGASNYSNTRDHISGGGGGTGVYGEGGSGGASTFGYGSGGSGGTNGGSPVNSSNSDTTGGYTKGGDYGGGGGGSSTRYWGRGGNGADGVVRLIYRTTGLETNLEFPSTDTTIRRLQTVI